MSIIIVFKNGDKLFTRIVSLADIEGVLKRKGYRITFVKEIHFGG